MDKVFFVIAALSGAVSVGLGAFGAHGLAARLSTNDLGTFETAVRYQFFHTLALFVVVFAITRWPASNLPVIAGWLFVAGIAIFSGSLYLLVMTGTRWLGAITPIGGVAFIVAWLLLGLAAWRS